MPLFTKPSAAVVLCAALCLSAPLASATGDARAGEAKAKEVCQACHGMDGNSTVADYPKIGGQYPDYLSKALRDYKSGARKNPIMAGFAGTLSKQDIDNVVAYYSSQPPAVVTKH